VESAPWLSFPETRPQARDACGLISPAERCSSLNILTCWARVPYHFVVGNCMRPRGTDMAKNSTETEQRVVEELPWLTEVDYPFGIVTSNGELMLVLEVINTYLCVTGDLFIEVALMDDDDEYDFADMFSGKIIESIASTFVNVSQIQRIIKSLEEFKVL
jgi:hypothetical protein